jgi:hypothetical protein
MLARQQIGQAAQGRRISAWIEAGFLMQLTQGSDARTGIVAVDAAAREGDMA